MFDEDIHYNVTIDEIKGMAMRAKSKIIRIAIDKKGKINAGDAQFQCHSDLAEDFTKTYYYGYVFYEKDHFTYKASQETTFLKKHKDRFQLYHIDERPIDDYGYHTYPNYEELGIEKDFTKW